MLLLLKICVALLDCDPDPTAPRAVQATNRVSSMLFVVLGKCSRWTSLDRPKWALEVGAEQIRKGRGLIADLVADAELGDSGNSSVVSSAGQTD